MREILEEELEGYVKGEVISAVLTPLKNVYTRFVEGFRRGGYDEFRVEKYSKRRKKYYVTHEKITRTKLKIYELKITFYHSSASRKDVIMK